MLFRSFYLIVSRCQNLMSSFKLPLLVSQNKRLENYCQKQEKLLPKWTPLSSKSCIIWWNNSHLRVNKCFFSSAWRSLNLKGCPVIKNSENRSVVINFVNSPDISYYCPGWKFTTNCWKSKLKEKVHKHPHYLLHTICEIVTIYNEENQED